MSAVVGDRPVYVLFRSISEFFVGSSADIYKSTATDKSRSMPLSVQIQLADIFGDQSGKIGLRHKIRNSILHSSGEASARRFDVGYARSTLWDVAFDSTDDILSKMHPREIMESFDVEDIGGGVRVSIDPNLSKALSSQTLLRINAIFRQRFDRSRQGDLFEPSRDDFSSPDPDPRLEEAYLDIKNLPRQEERLSHLLRLSIAYPEVGIPLLGIYRDKSRFANRAVSYAKSYLLLGMDQNERIRTVSHMVAPIVEFAFPMNRGLLLYELSLALGEFDQISDAISARLRQTNARAVADFRTAIENVLAKSRVSQT
jgi:hypothetical protein